MSKSPGQAFTLELGYYFAGNGSPEICKEMFLKERSNEQISISCEFDGLVGDDEQKIVTIKRGPKISSAKVKSSDF